MYAYPWRARSPWQVQEPLVAQHVYLPGLHETIVVYSGVTVKDLDTGRTIRAEELEQAVTIHSGQWIFLGRCTYWRGYVDEGDESTWRPAEYGGSKAEIVGLGLVLWMPDGGPCLVKRIMRGGSAEVSQRLQVCLIGTTLVPVCI